MSNRYHRQYYKKRRDQNSPTTLTIVVLCFATIALFLYLQYQPSLEQIIIIALCLFLLTLTIVALYLKNKNRKLARLTIDQIDKLDGIAFEHYLKQLLLANHFSQVKVTPPQSDKGIDLLATKGGLKYAIQAKRYRQFVGIDAIQQAFTGQAYYNCDKAMVITNSRFSPDAIETARKTGVTLIDRPQLKKMMEKVTQS